MRFKTFLHQAHGAVAVEFAFVVPVMLVLLFGGFEAGRMVDAFMRLNDSAQMMADLVSRQRSVTASQVQDFCSGVGIVMRPFSTVGFSATIASVTRSTSGVVVDWQDTSCGGRPIDRRGGDTGSALHPEPQQQRHPGPGELLPITPSSTTPSRPAWAIVKRGYARTRGGVSVAHD